ncbi:hypothetical protein C5167_021383 [Papaver somniferum]|uniref:Uncharacterized protein n=1 Tax=Papaver somniferum TaxID=3469 RepID=A0A4Y7IZX1_PAPSO|nr:hypothetical protein C5167_021383 [Papaver somniferum]
MDINGAPSTLGMYLIASSPERPVIIVEILQQTKVSIGFHRSMYTENETEVSNLDKVCVMPLEEF